MPVSRTVMMKCANCGKDVGSIAGGNAEQNLYRPKLSFFDVAMTKVDVPKKFLPMDQPEDEVFCDMKCTAAWTAKSQNYIPPQKLIPEDEPEDDREAQTITQADVGVMPAAVTAAAAKK